MWLALVALFASSFAPVGADPAPSAPTSLAALRAAMGCRAWRAIRAIRINGAHAADGLNGPFEEIDETQNGRSVATVHAGPFVSASGFDGTAAWSQDFSGASIHSTAHTRERSPPRKRGSCGAGGARRATEPRIASAVRARSRESDSIR